MELEVSGKANSTSIFKVVLSLCGNKEATINSEF